MDNHDKTRDELIKQVEYMTRRIAELEIQHKKTDEELLKAYFRKSLSNVPDGVFVIDKQGIFTYVNPTFLKMIGYEKRDVVGKTIQEIVPKIVPPDSVKIIQERIKQSLEIGEAIISAEVELLNRTGTTIPVAYSASGIKDEQGNVFREIVFLKDITEQKRVEEALRESGEKYKNFFENAGVGMYQVKLDGSGVLAVNKKLTEILGLSKEEILSNPAFMYWENPEDHEEMVKQLLHKGFVSDYEIRLVHKNGAVKTCLMSGKVYQKEGLLGGTLVDITDRKQSEKALRESESRLSSVIQSPMIGILFWNANGDITDANDAFLEMVEYTREEILSGKIRWRDITPPEFKEQDDKALQEITTTGVMTPIEKEYIHKNGTRIPVLLGAASLPGPILNGVAFVLDMSERKQLKEELFLKNLVFEASISANSTSDIKGNINHCNPAFLNLWGYDKKEEVLGKSIADFFMNKEETESVLQSMNTTGKWQGEFLAKRKDGSTFISRGYATVIKTEKGKMIGYQSANLDVTAQVQAKEKLSKTLEDLKRSNKELEQFAYVASHDLQEPLRMISSYTQLLGQRYKDHLDQNAKDFINYSIDGANRMQSLINDLLLYSRVGTKSIALTTTDCSSVIEKVHANLMIAIEENHVIITNDDLPTIVADEGQLVQLFQNLITNAIKFRRDENPRIHISAEEKADEWIFSIKDNGIGIESEFKDRIFVIFQRLHAKGKYSGTGMGLAICKKIVERHDGRIWLDSVPGKGTTFFFSIPKRRDYDRTYR
ncbi:PAS domain S-box protein [candidate division WOR-3 bacterium]|nr:PAS domain S-box protein [candidate division WOR-3 bacterium]